MEPTISNVHLIPDSHFHFDFDSNFVSLHSCKQISSGTQAVNSYNGYISHLLNTTNAKTMYTQIFLTVTKESPIKIDKTFLKTKFLKFGDPTLCKVTGGELWHSTTLH
jgi:hypothetical protein